MISLVASLFVLIGTWIQMKDQLGRLSATDPSGYAAFKVVEGWKGEDESVRHPVRWVRVRFIVHSLLQDSPSEADDYRRAARAVFSWGCLLVAASLFAALTAWDFLSGLL